ncbi:MAG: hypothetical protein V4568_03605 [Pseudomonadota bacterium]
MQLSRALIASAAVLGIGFYVTYSWVQTPIQNQANINGSTAASTTIGNLSHSTVTRSAFSVTPGSGKPMDDLTALREEVAVLRAEVSMLRRRIPTQGQAQAETEDTPAMTAEKNARTDPLARAEAEKAHQKQMAGVEAAFRNEPNDSKWSSRAASTLQDALTGDDAARANMRNVECRSHTCRVEIIDDGSGQLAKSMPLIAQRVAQTFPTMTANQIDQGNGTSTTVLYMSRDNTRP